MSIESLRIQGFRSLRDVTWKPGKLNVLIGPNGSGKSNLLRAIELLHVAADGDLSEFIISQGGFGPFLWDGRANRISWNLKVNSDPAKREILDYGLEIQQAGGYNYFRIAEEFLKANGKTLVESVPGQLSVYNPDRDEMVIDTLKRLKDPEQTSLLQAGVWPIPEPLVLAIILLSWSVYHDLRVDQSAPLRQAAVARFERSLALDGQNLIPVLHTLYTGDREFKKSVDSAMRAAFGDDFEELVFPPAADQRVQLRVRWRSLKTEQPAANLSDGTLRFLILLAILANPEPSSLIAIDEPETGLHPGMLPLIAEMAADAAERTQVVLSTHSPQLLDAFQGEAITTTVAQMVDGETRLTTLDGEELRRWLREYSLGSLFRSGELESLA
jgi:predicted ATPase